METTARSQDEAIPLSASDALLWEVLPNLHLNIAQTAALCGISVRQLGYWTKQGYVTASGRGVRRLYGLEALRRVLAIRHAMNNGASLRQALKTQAEGTAPPARTHAPETPVSPAADTLRPVMLSPQEASGLTADLLALFAANRDTRDDATGLAVKVGRSSSDIGTIAELLCTQGVLSKTSTHRGAVFQSVPREGV